MESIGTILLINWFVLALFAVRSIPAWTWVLVLATLMWRGDLGPVALHAQTPREACRDQCLDDLDVDAELVSYSLRTCTDRCVQTGSND